VQKSKKNEASKAPYRPRRSAEIWSLIGLRLSQLKEERRFTSAHLAREINVSPSQISRYLRDEARAPRTKVVQLARVLGVNPAYLAGESALRDIARTPLPDHVAQLHRRANRMSNQVLRIPDPVRQERVVAIAESLVS